MTPAELNAIRERADKATAGPWAWAQTADKGYGASVGAGVFADFDQECREPLSGDLSEHDGFYVDQHIADLGHQAAQHDAAFIAHARTDVPALLAEVDRLDNELDRATGDVMIIAHERDMARAALVVSDEMVDRAYEAWHAFRPTPTDASGYGAMRAALTAALSPFPRPATDGAGGGGVTEEMVERAAEAMYEESRSVDAAPWNRATRCDCSHYRTLARRALAAALTTEAGGGGEDTVEWQLAKARTALENWGRHFDWCASRHTVPEPCSCGLAEAIANLGASMFSEAWCRNAAEREGNAEVGVGGDPPQEEVSRAPQ